MSSKSIVSQFKAACNGSHRERNIPTIDNKIMVKTTRPFYLRHWPVPSGSIGRVVDLVADGTLYLVDFGLPLVARIAPGSDLIEPVNLIAEYAKLGVQRES